MHVGSIIEAHLLRVRKTGERITRSKGKSRKEKRKKEADSNGMSNIEQGISNGEVVSQPQRSPRTPSTSLRTASVVNRNLKKQSQFNERLYDASTCLGRHYGNTLRSGGRKNKANSEPIALSLVSYLPMQ